MKCGLAWICRAYGYSRQGYYKHGRLEEKRVEEEKKVLGAVLEIRKRQPRVGTRKLQRMLNSRGIEVGRDKLLEMLRKKGWLISRRKKYVRTTQSRHRFRVYRNEVRSLLLSRAEQVFVSDITYVSTQDGFVYLSLITDAYSRRIMGYCLSESLSIEGSLKALVMALRNRKDKRVPLIHHSDRGIQYCSQAYVDLLKHNKVTISMTEDNHVYENALAERVNGILKEEFGLGETQVSYEVAKNFVDEAITIYNHERLHMALDYITPAQKHAA